MTSTICNVEGSQTTDRYLILQYDSYKENYLAWADVESTDILNDDSFLDDLARERVFSDEDNEIILVKVLGPVKIDQSRIDKAWEKFEREEREAEQASQSSIAEGSNLSIAN